MQKKKDYVIGIDFGTASVRSVLLDAHSGEQVAMAEFEYPRWKEGRYCDPSKNQFRQHPLDYMEGLEYNIKNMLEQVPTTVAVNIRSISIATTGSTPVAVDDRGLPLALHEAFKENPNAMFFLWKDHSALRESEELNTAVEHSEVDYLQFSGGAYSPEWYWAKFLYVVRNDTAVYHASYSWVEHCDWIPFLLTGGSRVSEIKRSVCAAGHKAMWANEHGGLPPKRFFTSLDPLLEKFELPFYTDVFTTDQVAGHLSTEWAEKLGLSTEVLIGVGALDAHVGSVGGQIAPFFLSKVIGTSTCDMLVVPNTPNDMGMVEGICGQVQDSIIPGMVGLEAGQAAFGDAFDWFKNLVSATAIDFIRQSEIPKGIKETLITDIGSNLLIQLGNQAKLLPIHAHAELALDWLNGRRSPLANPYLKGGFVNLNLGSDAVRMYHSLVEATCFGARKIVEHFVEKGIPIKGVIALGGVAKKADFVMQMMADVLGMPIKVHSSEQTCALGACMFATVVAGVHPNVEVAMEKLGNGFDAQYEPHMKKYRLFSKRYEQYKMLGRYMEKEFPDAYLEK